VDAEFDRIYAEQIGAFRAMQFLAGPRVAVELVERAIDSALKELGERFELRADARLFLIANLTHMVAIPILQRAPGSQADLFGMLASDATSIAQAATRHAEGDRELSAASILLGTAEVLQKLRLKDWRLWDRRR